MSPHILNLPRYDIPPRSESGSRDDKNYTLLVIHKDLSEAENELLSNILTATKVPADESGIQKVTSAKEAYQILQQTGFTNCLLFDINPSEVWPNAQIPELNNVRFFDQNFVFCPKLNQLKKDKNAKRKLWAVMKALFLDEH